MNPIKFQKLSATILFCFLVHISMHAQSAVSTNSPTLAQRGRAENLRNSFGTYCAAPRLEDGRVDVAKLISELVEIHANTYSWCIHPAATDWDDLQIFLPLAKQKNIRVWASLLPPSESPPRGSRYSEPFKMDYEKWGKELAKLSLRETALVAWSIDDFTYNLKVYTPERLKTILEGAREINPKLAFLPCCYSKHISPIFAKNYGNLLDGIVFPYNARSANLTDASLVESEIKMIRTLAPSFSIFIDVYASPHSRLGKSTPEYVEQVMIAGRRSADGVMIYCHQDKTKNPEKYQILEKLFGKWSE